MPPDGGEPLYVLSANPSGTMRLAFGESGEVKVEARDLDGERVPGLVVTFLLEGSFKDSGLSTITAVTDDDGEAKTVVTAGYSNALFRVRASADDAVPTSRFVSVSEGGYGQMEVTVRYPQPWERALDSFELNLYFESSCNETRVLDRLPGERSIELEGAASATGTFDDLPATSTYAVTVSGRYATGAAFAWACIDGLTVAADETLPVELEAIDLPNIAEGGYYAELALALGAQAANVADAALTGGEAAIDESASDAAYLLDALEASLGAQSDEFAMLRATNGLDADLAAALGTDGPTEAVATAAAAIEAELAGFALEMDFVVLSAGVVGDRLELTPTRLRFDDDVTVVLGDAGITVPTTETSTFDALDSSAAVVLEFGLSTPELARAALLAAAERAGMSLSEWLAGPAGCAALASSPDVVSAAETVDCDVACVEAACEAATITLVDAMEQEVANGAYYASVRALGTLAFVEPPSAADLEVDAIESTLACALVDGPSTAVVTGSLTGSRVDASDSP